MTHVDRSVVAEVHQRACVSIAKDPVQRQNPIRHSLLDGVVNFRWPFIVQEKKRKMPIPGNPEFVDFKIVVSHVYEVSFSPVDHVKREQPSFIFLNGALVQVKGCKGFRCFHVKAQLFQLLDGFDLDGFDFGEKHGLFLSDAVVVQVSPEIIVAVEGFDDVSN